MKRLTAVILAGGSGSRFWPLRTNKIVFPFLGRPLFSYSVLDVLPKELTNIVIVANPDNADELRTVEYPVPAEVVVQHEAKGMADALMTAREHIEGSSILVLIADDVFDPGLLAEVLAKSNQTDAFGIIPGWKPKKYFDGGYFEMEDERIVGIVEKPGEGNEPSPYTNISGHFIRDASELLRALEQTTSQSDDVYEKALTHLMKKNVFLPLPYEGIFSSLKFPWNVLDIMEYFLHHRMKSYRGENVIIKPNVIIEGNVYIEDNVKIFENTKITGPCFIGKDTIIGNNNIIRDSSIGRGCVTGFNTDITRSYIGDGCWFHTNYIGDSVLEENISMGSGAVLANLRLDENEIHSIVKGNRRKTTRTKLGAVVGKDVRIGVNASIMPGVKIGHDCFVGSGVVLDRDLPDGSFCMAKEGYTILPNRTSIGGISRDTFRKKI